MKQIKNIRKMLSEKMLILLDDIQYLEEAEELCEHFVAQGQNKEEIQSTLDDIMNRWKLV